VYYQSNGGSNATVGVSGLLSINDTASLPVFILGSIRTIRDYTQGPSTLYTEIQDATSMAQTASGKGVVFKRTWLDNLTTTTLSFEPVQGSGGQVNLTAGSNVTTFAAGVYNMTTHYDYPQLTALSPDALLTPLSQDLLTSNTTEAEALGFLSYQDKLLAGGWNYLTYFGRDSSIATLLLLPILKPGQYGPIETTISALLTRLNGTVGQVCHEETIGDYATWTNMQNNITSTSPGCTYIMLDADFYLQIVMQAYFVDTVTGPSRKQPFLATQANNDFGNGAFTFAQLALLNAERIMNYTKAFAGQGNQTVDNLLHILPGQVVGNWRDSTYGIGGGQIPFDVNTALAPAALRAIGALSRAGTYPSHPEWNTLADEYAQIWEDDTLSFFNNSISVSTAGTNLKTYSNMTGIPGPVPNVTQDVNFFSISLLGNNNLSNVAVMHTDDCFRLYLLNTTNQSQLSDFLSQTADHILNPFPLGLSTNLGLLVANPAFLGDAVYATNWTNAAYHGTVIWSWPMAMMAAGLERQLGRCNSNSAPEFCGNTAVYGKVKMAYNRLWDIIEANTAYLSTEVWSWGFGADDVTEEGDGSGTPASLNLQYKDFGQVSATEADIVQLWSLAFLAVTRNPKLN
jgi:hypothetical protein